MSSEKRPFAGMKVHVCQKMLTIIYLLDYLQVMLSVLKKKIKKMDKNLVSDVWVLFTF